MVGKALGRSDAGRRGGRGQTAGRDRRRQGGVPRSSTGKSFIFAYLTTADLSTIGIYTPGGPAGRASCTTSAWSTRRAVAERDQAGRVLRHGLRRAGRRPRVRRVPHLRRGRGRHGDVRDDKLIGQIPAIDDGPRAAPRRTSTIASLSPTRRRCRSPTRWSDFVPRWPRPSTARDPVLDAPPGRPRRRRAPAAVGPDGAPSPRPGRRRSSVVVASRRCSSAPGRSRRRRLLDAGRPGARDRRRPGSTAPCSALAVGAALGLAGALHAGADPQPAGRPGHPRHQRRRVVRDGAGDLRLRRLRRCRRYLWFAFVGAAVAAVLVHAIASLGRDGATPVKLAIAGAALTAALRPAGRPGCC